MARMKKIKVFTDRIQDLTHVSVLYVVYFVSLTSDKKEHEQYNEEAQQ